MTSNDSRPLLFISHRHADSKLADALRTFVINRCLGQISVFQSSSVGHALEIGKNINQQLMDKLYQANAVVLLYTATDQDWSYCMWECGVATDPASPNTRIVVFQCAGYCPSLFADQVRVDIRNKADIQKFTKDFLTDPGFFPKYGKAIAPNFEPNGAEVRDAAEDLYKSLQEVLPPMPDEPPEEWPAWPFLQLELGLDSVNCICDANPEQRLQVAREIIQQQCLVSAGDRVAAQQLFGIASFQKRGSFQELINLWKENNPESQSQWVEVLCTQIMQAAQWKFPNLTWELMKGVNNVWYAPVLNHVRKIPNQKCMQFDIYFYKFDVEPDCKSVKVGIPSE